MGLEDNNYEDYLNKTIEDHHSYMLENYPEFIKIQKENFREEIYSIFKKDYLDSNKKIYDESHIKNPDGSSAQEITIDGDGRLIDKNLHEKLRGVVSKLNGLGLKYTGVKKETGSHSIVYQFVNPHDGNYHAIKINFENDNNREVLRARDKTLEDITNSEGRADFPFIVNAEVYDGFIKMPWYDEFLSDRLEDGEKVEIRSAIDYSKTLLESLCAVHDVNGLDRVHRDIKPDNIAIDSSKRLLIADFGISTCANPDEQLSEINGGTGFPCTRSPEAFDSEERETKSSDVFSTANLIGRMMTGKYLYGGFFDDSETIGEAEDRIREIDEKEHNEILKGYLKQVPRHFRKFLKKSMAYNSEKRYQDALEMKVGLDRAVKKHEPATLGRMLRNNVITLLTGLSICGASTAYHASHQIEDLKDHIKIQDKFWGKDSETQEETKSETQDESPVEEYLRLEKELSQLETGTPLSESVLEEYGLAGEEFELKKDLISAEVARDHYKEQLELERTKNEINDNLKPKSFLEKFIESRKNPGVHID